MSFDLTYPIRKDVELLGHLLSGVSRFSSEAVAELQNPIAPIFGWDFRPHSNRLSKAPEGRRTSESA
ncbi:MAG: hypothetical protein FVQ78_01695 [Solirubrobacterales bacterium]|nr:hypothetical protein [Solirubrobacterales bacterium]